MNRKPITEFRARLAHQIATYYDGQYTRLAKRAGLPPSSMQHIMRHAKHLPGAEHLIRLANVLGVTVDYLIGGDAIRPKDILAQPLILIQGRHGKENIELDRHIAVPVFTCRCPKPCPLGEDIPPVDSTRDRVVIPQDLVTNRHRLIGIVIADPLVAPDWKPGTRLVFDWDARKPDWNGIFLVRDRGRCKIGRVHADEDRLLIGPADGFAGPPYHLAEGCKILGRVVAEIRPG